ncbi:MAG: hypothetical protein JF625_01020 [Inquilinus limosus]|uniref:Type II secretion system protein GspG C-terminal domain-containing protein n=1 Tax=Inquilinus limosus TaxID=171674 RepID=A0A952FJZ6_9PROT|nr:hypothetical protein [Inquilinus limosus]
MTAKGERLSGFPFVVGGLSFIPLIGVPFGIAAIVWGVVTKKAGGKKLAIVGACGIALTILLYGSLFYFGFVQRGGVYDELRARMAQTTLNGVLPAVEVYRLQNGTYPDSLEQLRASLPKDSTVMVIDGSNVRLGGTEPRPFFYQRVDADHYYLRGVGPDGKPFTADDVLPQAGAGPAGRLGLLTDPPARP